MTDLQAATALNFARSMVGKSILPQGMCLNFVWRSYGSVPSVGAAVGHLTTAAGAWSVVQKKHLGDRNVPAGYWAYLGPSPTRTDKNKNAGDAILSIGGGLFICTDASGARVGIMTLAAREKETARPYVGWAEDLGGHPIKGGVTITTSSSGTPIAISPTAPKPAASAANLEGLEDMFAVQILANGKRPGAIVPKGAQFIVDLRDKTITRVDTVAKLPAAKLQTLKDEFGTLVHNQPGGKPIGWGSGDTAWRYADGGYTRVNW